MFSFFQFNTAITNIINNTYNGKKKRFLQTDVIYQSLIMLCLTLLHNNKNIFKDIYKKKKLREWSLSPSVCLVLVKIYKRSTDCLFNNYSMSARWIWDDR